MTKQHIVIDIEVPVPVEKLFAFLSEQENMAKLFAPAKVTRICDGHNSRNGVGSTREVKIPLSPRIEETNTVFEKNQRIEYTVTNKTVIKDHSAMMQFSPSPKGSRLHYEIHFSGVIPFTGFFIKKALETVLKRNVKKLQRI